MATHTVDTTCTKDTADSPHILTIDGVMATAVVIHICPVEDTDITTTLTDMATSEDGEVTMVAAMDHTGATTEDMAQDTSTEVTADMVLGQVATDMEVKDNGGSILIEDCLIKFKINGISRIHFIKERN